MDRLATLDTFAKVAETQSFSEAARRLRSSKSAVSRHVAALEAELGARLFHRTTRSLTLTEAGRGYYERASRILADLADADASVSQLQAAPRGRLRVNAPMSFGFLHLAPALGDFLALYPEIELDVTLTDRFVDLIDEGVDVAVRIGSLTDSSLVARRLAVIRRVLCASPDYLKARGVPATPDALKAHDCLSNTNITVTREWRFIHPDGTPSAGAAWPVEVKGRMSANNGDMLRVAALRGHGFVHLPTFIVGEDLRAGTLVSVLDPYIAQDLTLNAVYPTARHLSPKVRAFVDFLAGRFGGPKPYWDASA
ncbi:MAG: LysR family transcriptional regulator [Proteobacteria bacterium]|nr:LysR family transcriptional regulator [Pseudomonadota bacterium]